MRVDTVIKNCNVITPAGAYRGDVGISGEKIAALGAELDVGGAKVIDAAGHHVIPGVLDVHVHLELPFCGTVSADDYRSGTRAGARRRPRHPGHRRRGAPRDSRRPGRARAPGTAVLRHDEQRRLSQRDAGRRARRRDNAD